MKTLLISCIPTAIVVALSAAPLSAQSGADSMEGRTITVYIPVEAGGGYDAYGRLVASHIGRHIRGNPTVIASNMPGGGGRKLANYIYNAAPKDGSAIAIIHHTTVYDAVFGTQGVQYDSTRFNWFGSLASETLFVLTWHTTGVRTLEDAKNKEITMGATGAGATSFQYLSLLRNMFGAKFKIITGYTGARAIYMAVEKSELDGTGGMTWAVFRNSYEHLLRDKKVNLLVQIALEKDPQLPDVPLITELARTSEEKRLLEFALAGLQFARPFMGPPGMPKATADMYRAAITAVAADPQLRAEAKKRRFDIDPLDGATVQKMVENIYNAPADIRTKAQQMLTGK